MVYDIDGTIFKFDRPFCCSHGMTVIDKNTVTQMHHAIVPLAWDRTGNGVYIHPMIILGTAELEVTETELKAHCILNDTPASQLIKKRIEYGEKFELGFYGINVKYAKDKTRVTHLDMRCIYVLPPEYIGPPIYGIDNSGNIILDTATN